jgi:hypothetical protein
MCKELFGIQKSQHTANHTSGDVAVTVADGDLQSMLKVQHNKAGVQYDRKRLLRNPTATEAFRSFG